MLSGRRKIATLLTTGSIAIAALTVPAAAGSGEPAVTPLLDPTAISAGICRPGQGTSPFRLRRQVATAAPWAKSKNEDGPPLWDNLGNLSYPIDATSKRAQRYFDQGLRLTYAFNHAEALRSFREAQKIDPGCAMCYWGEALVLGPNINKPMEPGAIQPAYRAVRKALALSPRVTERERGLIGALAKRYSANPKADRKALDAAYANAMAKLAGRYRDDAEIAVLFAESLMNLSPWDYWEADKKTPKGRTAEIIATLEHVLEHNPNHPAAIHLYIHTVEASATPERAEHHADRLGHLMPGAGHLVHMPSHIYIRVGRFLDSLKANVDAVAADEAYLAQVEAAGIYPNGYYPHNIHFVVASAQMAGKGKIALEYSEKLAKSVDDETARAIPWVQAIKTAPYFAHAQFSDPATILALPDPGDRFPFVRAMWHYARSVALATKGDTSGAIKERAAIERIGKTTDFSAMVAGGVPVPDVLQLARHVATGRIQQAGGNLTDAIASFRQAVVIQDAMAYMEPPYWYYPVRQSLGAVLLAAGKRDQAEQVFRQSLVNYPNNGWALYGLMQTQKAQGDAAAAAATNELLRRAWAGGQSRLTLSRL